MEVLDQHMECIPDEGAPQSHPRDMLLVDDNWVKERWNFMTTLGEGTFAGVHIGIRSSDQSRFAVKICSKAAFNVSVQPRETGRAILAAIIIAEK